MDKALPPDDPLRELGHGAAGAAWLSEHGHAELARTLIAHPVTRLTEPDAETWVSDAPIEERIVAYADKRATQRVVSLEQRFDRWCRKHPEYRERLRCAFGVAQRLEDGLCTAIGIQATDVERLRWVDDAMSRAFAAGVPDRRPAESVDGLPVFDAPADPSAA